MKKLFKAKIVIFSVILLLLVFFTNDFGIIDIEKIAIVTAIGIDKEDDEFEVTLQIALPEASDTSSENKKAVISAKGKTASAAIYKVGGITGWYPKLAFCNLLVLGESMLNENVKSALDYFSKTLKVQDSSFVASCEGSAKELLNKATPLDNISSFAIQKILLKTFGMTSDVATVDIKTFSIGYYSRSGSSFMPLIKTVKVEGEDGSSSGGEEGGNKGNFVFNASSTLLFKNGIKVGVLDEHETKCFNLVSKKVSENALAIENVDYSGKSKDVLLTVIKNKYKLKLRLESEKIVFDVFADFFCRVEDSNITENDENLKEKSALSKFISDKAESDFNRYFNSLKEKCRISKCDLFKLDEKLFRYHNNRYDIFKDKLYDNLTLNIKVNFYGVK